MLTLVVGSEPTAEAIEEAAMVARLTRWSHYVEINDLLDNVASTSVPIVSNQIAARLHEKPHLFSEWEYTPEDFKGITTADGLQFIMDTLYSFADEHRIWLGS